MKELLICIMCGFMSTNAGAFKHTAHGTVCLSCHAGEGV